MYIIIAAVIIALAIIKVVKKPQTFKQSKLEYLAETTNAQVTVKINGHKDSDFDTIETYLEGFDKDISSFDIDVYELIIELDTIVEIELYESGSVGHYKIWHYDLKDAIDEALELIKL